MENSTSLMVFCMTFLVFFGFFSSITGQGTVNITLLGILEAIIGAAIVAVAAAAIVGGIAGFEIFGIGSSEAGQFAWKAAIFAFIASMATWFGYQLINLMPIGTPTIVSIIFIAPSLAGLLWGFFSAWLRSAGEG